MPSRKQLYIQVRLRVGETAMDAARRVGYAWRAVQAANPEVNANDRPEALRLRAPSPGCPKGAFVRSLRGETAASFAGRFGLTLHALCQHNPYVNPSIPLDGQVLLVPWDIMMRP